MRRKTLLSAVVSLVAAASILGLAPAAEAHFTPVGRIAYVATVNDHRAIFSVDPTKPFTGSSLIDLRDRDASEPAWSFYGTQIAFTAQTSPGGPTAIFVANGDGSGIEQVTFPGAGESDSDASWSPSGEEIVFARELPTVVSGIRIVSLATGTVRPLDFPSLPSATEPDWSPEGSRIAFVARQVVDPSACDSDPASCTWRLFVANADGTGEPRALQPSGSFNYHNPDWAPDATAVAVEFSSRTDPTLHLVVVLSTSTSGFVRALNGTAYEPSWSPYGLDQLVGRFGSTSSVFVVLYDGDQLSVLLSSGSQPAWGALPGVPPIIPPPFETTPPTIDFTFLTNEQGWLQGPRGQVVSQDPSGVSLYCTLDGQFLQTFYSPPGSATAGGDLLFYNASEGEHVVRCTATDRWGNQAIKSAIVKVDLTPPTLGAISFGPKVRRIDQTTDVAIPFVERGSGLNSASVQLGSGAQALSFPLSASDSTLTGAIGTSVPAGIWPLSASAADKNGNRSSRNYFFDYLVVYDPSAGSVNGTGWIVPGGPTSDIYENLPGGVDGKSKASFSFKAQYKSATSTTPIGFFNLSYGSQFKFQSESFDWLVVSGPTAVLRGTATIKDMAGTFMFQATLTDGVSTGSSDRLELRVWPTGSDPFRDTAQFQATGDAGGQIQIQR